MPPTTPHPALALCARVLVLALLCGLQGVLPAAAASADPAAARTTGPGDPAQVLVITGTDPYLPAFVAIDAAMRAAIAQRHPRHYLSKPINLEELLNHLEKWSLAIKSKENNQG